MFRHRSLRPVWFSVRGAVMNAALDALASKKKPAPTSKERQEHRASCPMVPLAEQYWENVRNLELAAVVQSAQSLASHQPIE